MTAWFAAAVTLVAVRAAPEVKQKRLAETDGYSLTLVERSSPGAIELDPSRATVVVALKGASRVGDGSVDDTHVAVGSENFCPATLTVRGPATFLVLSAPKTTSAVVERAEPLACADGSAVLQLKSPAPEAYPLGPTGEVRFLSRDFPAYVGLLTLNATAVVKEHVHEASAELVYIVEGRGEMTVAGKKVLVQPGTAVHVPKGVPHSFKAGPKAKVRGVQFYTPPGPEERFVPAPPSEKVAP